MLVLSLLTVLATASSSEVEEPIECPTCIHINETCFNVSHVLDLDAPFRNQVVIHKLSMLRADNTLFYAFEPRIEDPEYYKVGFVNLDAQNISGIITSDNPLNFGSFDIDQDNGVIYLGGSEGIYALDTNANKLSSYSSRGDTITDVFFKNNVYFVKYNGHGITVKKGDNFRILLENTPVRLFVINKYDFIVFVNNFGLHVAKGETTRRLSKNAFFRGLAMDLDGNIYAWWIDGIYRVFVDKNLNDSRVIKIADLPKIGALTFDNENNLMFTSSRSLYRLTKVESVCKI